MQTLIVIAIAGLAAQLVDGSLGMGYGLTSSTLLIFAGLSPAAASACVIGKCASYIYLNAHTTITTPRTKSCLTNCTSTTTAACARIFAR